MSLLAEPKRKVKYSLNPRGHLWANDESKFGKRMLEKMGWSKGKGLGKNEDGMQEHIKTSHHFNTEGYKEKDNLPQMNYEYEQLLANLNAKSQKRKKESEPKQSQKKPIKVRHRYKKIREAKDVSSYSHQDLATILAVNKKKSD